MSPVRGIPNVCHRVASHGGYPSMNVLNVNFPQDLESVHNHVRLLA
jgi:hypothetical protein